MASRYPPKGTVRNAAAQIGAMTLILAFPAAGARVGAAAKASSNSTTGITIRGSNIAANAGVMTSEPPKPVIPRTIPPMSAMMMEATRTRDIILNRSVLRSGLVSSFPFFYLRIRPTQAACFQFLDELTQAGSVQGVVSPPWLTPPDGRILHSAQRFYGQVRHYSQPGESDRILYCPPARCGNDRLLEGTTD